MGKEPSHLGIPGIPGREGQVEVRKDGVSSEFQPSEESDRPEDSGIGIPKPPPTAVRPLTKEEQAAFEDYIDSDNQRTAETMLRELEANKGGIKVPKGILRSVSILIVTVVGAIGVLLITQIASSLAAIQQLSNPLQTVLIVTLLVCGGMLLWVILRLLWLLVKLRRTKRVQLDALKELRERGGWHAMQLATMELSRAKADVLSYLSAYKVDNDKHKDIFFKTGMTSEELLKIRQAKAKLCDLSKDPGAAGWLEDFRHSFQSVLDDVARRRIKSVALRVGLGTAVSPHPLLDLSIVLYSSLELIGDLCVLYNLKSSRLSNVAILGKVIVNAFIASHAQAISKQGSAILAESLANSVGVLASKVIGGVASRATEGTANALLIHRLGRTTTQMLRPVADID